MKYSVIKRLAAVLVFALLLSGMAEANEVEVKIANIWLEGNTINYVIRFSNVARQKLMVRKLTLNSLSIWDDRGRNFRIYEPAVFSGLNLEIRPGYYVEKTLHSRIRNVAGNYFNNWGKLGWKYDYYVNFDRLGNNRQRRR